MTSSLTSSRESNHVTEPPRGQPISTVGRFVAAGSVRYAICKSSLWVTGHQTHDERGTCEIVFLISFGISTGNANDTVYIYDFLIFCI